METAGKNNRGREARNVVWRAFLILAGGFIAAAGINVFLVPFKLLTAGVAGVALLIHYIAPFAPVGVLMILLNIPIFILAWIYIDRRFTIWSFFGMISLSGFLEITRGWSAWMPVNDLYMALIVGGLLSGVGVGLTFRARGSMGGTDILAAIIRKYYSTSIGSAQFVLNAAIVLALGLLFTFQSALASAFSIFFEAWATDRTILGLNTSVTLMVITDSPHEVGDALMNQLRRGVTYFSGKGAYLGKEKEIVYCVLPMRQMSLAKAIVERIDPNSFSTVSNTVEVIGRGFKRLPI
jgi:uncharacterized membrane-anchored protein YitT (DUF2179 family)